MSENENILHTRPIGCTAARSRGGSRPGALVLQTLSVARHVHNTSCQEGPSVFGQCLLHLSVSLVQKVARMGSVSWGTV